MSSSPARYFPGIPLKGKGVGGLESDSIRELVAEAQASENSEEISDEALLLRLQQQDIEALGLLYRRYARVVYSVCFRILRDAAEAEDQVHEVFLSLYRKCKSFDPKRGAARSWIIQLAYSRCFDWRDHLKARHGQVPGSDAPDAPPVDISNLTHEPDPAYSILWNASMVAAFKGLSIEQQLSIGLFYFKGYTFHEIAEDLGYSYGNVKHHIYRGIERLRMAVFEVGDRPATSKAEQETKCILEDMAG